MRTILQDLNYGVRALLKNPGFALIASITLAIGISANATIFSVVNAVLLRSLPFENSERLVLLWSGIVNSDSNRIPLSYLNFTDYKNQSESFERVAAYAPAETVFTSEDGEPEKFRGVIVTADLFPLLGVKPALGRVFRPEEEQIESLPVVVLSSELWRRRFASDPNLIEQQIILDGRPTKVIGIMPSGFNFPLEEEKSDYWMPLTANPANRLVLANRYNKFLIVIAKLKPETSLPTAQSGIEIISRRLELQYPEVNTGWMVRLVPLQEDIVGNLRPSLLVLQSSVLLILLIACANVANLLLSQSAARAKEIAVRAALGAGRGRIVRQLLTESLLLAFLGAGLALLIAVWGIDLIKVISPANLPRVSEINLDARVIGFTLVISVLTGIIFGFAPVLYSYKLNLNEILKESGRRATEGLRRYRLRGLLMVVEFALSLMIAVGAGLLIKSFVNLLETNLGYDPDGVFVIEVSLSEKNYPQVRGQAAFYQTVFRRLKSLPEVEFAGATSLLPLGGKDSYNIFNVEGRSPFEAGKEPSVRFQTVSDDYFRAMKIPLRQGRFFSEEDDNYSPPVVIVNEAFANSYLSGENPLGKRLLIGDEPPRVIIGVVGDIRHQRLEDAPQPEFYVSYLQSPRSDLNLVIRATTDNSARLSAAIRNTIKAVDKNQLIGETRTMNQMIANSVAPRFFNLLLLGIFALIAMLLSSVGIYSVMTYWVAQRTHEIGIRIALGAQRRDVLLLTAKRGIILALIGVGIGLLGAFALTPIVMDKLLYGVSPNDAQVFALVSVLTLLLALLACYIPARRATKIASSISLRSE